MLGVMIVVQEDEYETDSYVVEDEDTFDDLLFGKSVLLQADLRISV